MAPSRGKKQAMKELESYSIDELEELTGYDRRTISYYISGGLLPKVGRRGPKTRYGREFVDRLAFIRRARDLQDAGKLPSVTLEGIGEILNSLPPEEIIEASKSNRKLLAVFADISGVGEGSDTNKPGGQMWASPGEDNFDSAGLDSWAEAVPESRLASASSRRRYMANDLEVSELMELRSPEASSDAVEASHTVERARTVLDSAHQELERLQEQQRKMREEGEREIEKTRLLAEATSELRKQMQDEVDLLRKNIDELRYQRQKAKPAPRSMELRRRAQMFAKRNHLPLGHLLVAQLRSNPEEPARRAWHLPISQRDIRDTDDVLTVFCEGREPEFEGEFVVLRIPVTEAIGALMPLFKKKTPGRTRCILSAEDDDYLQSINCPGLDFSRFVHPMKHR